MRKLLFALLLCPSLAFAQGIIPGGSSGGAPSGAAGGVLSGTYPNPGFAASPTFTGTVTIPSPFTLGATSVTTTGTQLNLLNAATGTTGTTSTNIVFSTSPSIATPTITGSFTATGLVTNASLASMSTATIKGQTSGGSGAPVDLTATQAATIIATVGGTLKSAVVSTTRDLTTASGTQAITGVGFVPTSCLIFTTINAGTASSFGFSDSARTAGSISSTTDGVATWTWNAATFVIQITNNAATAFQTASVQSYDADGLTLSWTKTGSPTGTLQMKFLCMR